ncbi:hypothetical protein BDY19DRAFT_354359 [Irpex rosettiformis]|uniref:Uncharacterized protein n=1 Tax=Irpex rosettiformis TaxID=378272 RepID=A0ACB8TWY1_9APHY|nr:hypothetical protein BDY19DRAFT_354359 [Irpex rosettiformis]
MNPSLDAQRVASPLETLTDHFINCASGRKRIYSDILDDSSPQTMWSSFTPNSRITGNVFSMSDKLTSITLFLLTPLFMVVMFTFCSIMLTIRGLPFGLIILTIWEHATHTVPNDAPSFFRAMLDTSQIGIIGSVTIGTLIGVVTSIVYLARANVPVGIRSLAPQRRLPYISSDGKKGVPWQYRGDAPIVVCAGIVIGSATVPVAYCAMRQWGWTLKNVPEDATRPTLIAFLGALCSTIVEYGRARSQRADEEKMLSVNDDNLGADLHIMTRWSAGEEVGGAKPTEA